MKSFTSPYICNTLDECGDAKQEAVAFPDLRRHTHSLTDANTARDQVPRMTTVGVGDAEVRRVTETLSHKCRDE